MRVAKMALVNNKSVSVKFLALWSYKIAVANETMEYKASEIVIRVDWKYFNRDISKLDSSDYNGNFCCGFFWISPKGLSKFQFKFLKERTKICPKPLRKVFEYIKLIKSHCKLFINSLTKAITALWVNIFALFHN